MKRPRRQPAAAVAGCALLAAAAGDMAQGPDGPGPLIALAVALVVLFVPRRPVPALAVAASAFFLAGAAANSADLTDALDNGVLPAVGVVVQLAGFVVAAAAGCLALRRGAPSPAS